MIDEDDEEEDPEFRYLSSDCGIQPSKRNNYGIPKDVIDMFRASSSTSSNETSDPPNTLDDVINNRLENVSSNEKMQSKKNSIRYYFDSFFIVSFQIFLNHTEDQQDS